MLSGLFFNIDTKTFLLKSLVFCSYFFGGKAKGRISKRVLQVNKARQIFRKTNMSYPLVQTHVCVSGGKKRSFFAKFDLLCFLVTLVLRFALLPYYRRLVQKNQKEPFPSTETFLFKQKKLLTQNKTKLTQPTILMKRQMNYLSLLMSYIPHDVISQKGLFQMKERTRD